MSLNLYQTSSLNKTITDSGEKPISLKRLSCVKGEEISYQIVADFSWQHNFKARAKLGVE